MKPLTRLVPGRIYHIYNRGNNGENIFVEERNYRYFVHLYLRHIGPVALTYAYCLLRNHFHLLVRVREVDGETGKALDGQRVSQCFANLFNAYAKAMNKAYGRTGSLFEEHFGRIEVGSETYFGMLVRYIHRNPEKHGFVKDFREYPYSSYAAFLVDTPTRLERGEVLEWFGGRAGFEKVHETEGDTRKIAELVGAD